MATAPPRLMTADEFFHLPDDGRYELVEGRLEEVGGGSEQSSLVAATILTLLNIFVRLHKLGKVGGAGLGAKLFDDPDTVRVPDVSFISKERYPQGKVARGFRRGAPDLVVEVLSPSDRYRRTRRKVDEYLAAGARLVWVFDPDDRSVVVHRAGGTVTEYGENDVLDGGDVLPGFTLALAEVWEEAEE